MNATIMASELRGTVRAISSKSQVHRMLIGAALADQPVWLNCRGLSNDVIATMNCLKSLGANVVYTYRLAPSLEKEVSDSIYGHTVRLVNEEDVLRVTPLTGVPKKAVLDPGESGSTYRFFTPLVAALGVETHFNLHGKLPSRPMDDLWREMERHGVTISDKGTDHPVLTGQLTSGEYRLPGSVSSQFFTGLLFTLPLLNGDSRIAIEGKLESAGYIDMTLDALSTFGIGIERGADFFAVSGGQKFKVPEMPDDGRVVDINFYPEGDWSNSAFWLCAGAAKGEVGVSRLMLPSHQGDSAVVEILRRMGADVSVQEAIINDTNTVKASAWKRDGATISACARKGITVDVSDIPDLVPALAVAAMAAKGRTVFENAGRLRLKESDRIASVCAAVNALGGKAFAEGDLLIIEGGERPKGGTVDACGDHRIAMLAAAAAPWCTGMVKIIGAEAVDKSYPGFWHDFASLGGKVWLEEV